MEVILGNDQINMFLKVLLKCSTAIRNMEIFKYILNLVGMQELDVPVIFNKKNFFLFIAQGEEKNISVKRENALYLLMQTVPCS